MDAWVLLKGIGLGISIAAPVGPMGVLCIRRTLVYGRLSGLVTGLGVATADALYGCLASFGLTALSQVVLSQQVWIRLIGGGFLIYLGIKTFWSAAPPSLGGENLDPMPAWKAFGSAVLLTLTNPATILAFTAIFAGLGIGSSHPDPLSASLLVLGVYIGSALWWLSLSWVTSWLGTRLDPARLVWVSRLSGLVIAGFGLGVWLTIEM